MGQPDQCCGGGSINLTDMVIMPGADYKAACDAIREKNGGTDLIKSGDMAGLILGIEVGGGDSDGLTALIEGTITDIEHGTLDVGEYALAGNRLLSRASFPNAKAIGESAFYYCEELKEVYIPEAERLLTNAFYGCIRLPSISLPSVKYIHDGCFMECYCLSEVYAPVAETIGRNAFRFAPITHGDFPKVKTVGSSAFEQSGIVTANLPSATSIAAGAFLNVRTWSEWIFHRL